MSHYIIADPSTDGDDFWKYQRRRHLTASDIFKFLPGDVLLDKGWWIESWMARDSDGTQRNMNWATRQTLERKREDFEITFRDPVAVKWGQVEEDHNRELFEKYAGVKTRGTHTLVKNDRWPYLAASLDGYIKKPEGWTGIANPEMFDKPAQVSAALDRLGHDTYLLEMKQTSDFGSAHWLNGKKTEPRNIIAGNFRPQPPSVPVYYRAQVLTQMAIREIPTAVAVVKAGASHMTAHTMQLDLDWPEILDTINEEVSEEMESIRKDIDNE